MTTAIVIAICVICVASILFSAFSNYLEFKRWMETEHHRLADRNLDLDEKKFELHREMVYDQMNKHRGPGLAKTRGGNGKLFALNHPRDDHQDEVGSVVDDAPHDPES